MRLIASVILGLLLVAVVILALLLVPAHLQVRSVEPPLPSRAELLALLETPDRPIAIRYVNTSTQRLGNGQDLGHTVFLVEWRGGDLFMIDAGMDRAEAVEFGKLIEFALDGDEAVPHGPVAEQLGDAVSRVAGVGLTHLHIDHTQGLVPFCEARGDGAVVLQTHWQDDLQNFNTSEGDEIVENSCLEKGSLEGDVVLQSPRFPGLGIVGLGGHTPGSTLFAVPASDQLFLFSGDITNSKAEIEQDLPKAFAYSTFMVPEHTKRTKQLRKWLADLDAEEGITVVVSHDLGDVRESGIAEWKVE